MTTSELIPVDLPADLLEKIKDPAWRMSNLYKIITKDEDDEDDEGMVVTFKPNRAQRRLIARLHHRNIILKARQMGFTTLIALLWLDTALFSKSPIRCGIIAQDRETAESIFKGKIRYAYDQLPEILRQMFPLKTENASELEFAHNNATIRVATSMRGGTTHRLHVSEFGKICAKTPDKAKEVITGSIPSVPKSGILVIESTAEGQEGAFYDMTERAAAQQEQGTTLTPKDYRFHFFAWWEMPEYELDPADVIVTETMHRYFTDVEGKIGQLIPQEKRAWYCATMESDFSGDQSLMWQEYPSYREEAFQLSTQGCYYTNQLSLARKTGRVLKSIPRVMSPVNTFWDIGKGDMTSIWLHQRVGMENRFIGYYEESGEDLDHYANWLQGLGVIFGTHYIPHETEHKRIAESKATSRSIKEMLEGLMPGQRFEVVPVTPSITAGIQSVRNVFASCYFDETACSVGLKRLATYKKEWDKRNGCFKPTPVHDDASHGSDAFRQFGQEADSGNQFHNGLGTSMSGWGGRPRPNRRRSGMAV